MAVTEDREWQVAIFGTFDVANYGDLLFPILAERELSRRLGRVKLHRFSYHARQPSAWPYAVTSLTELPELADKLDAVLIGGGFIIRFDKFVATDYLPPDSAIHHPTGYWLTPALMALQQGIPVIWNAPGMHCNDLPPWAAPMLRLVLEQSARVRVRDALSRSALMALTDAAQIDVLPDTAFGLPRLLDPGTPSEACLRLREDAGLTNPYLVVHAIAGLERFLHLWRTHEKWLPDLQLLVLPIGPVLGNHESILGEDLPRSVCLPAWPQPELLAELIGGSVGVIGHSYHLAITAIAFGVPVFCSADLGSGKYSALKAYGRVHPLSKDADIDPQWFLAQLGKQPPSAAATEALAQVDAHWDEVAHIIRAGKRPTGPAVNRFWQALPGYLEILSEPSPPPEEARESDCQSLYRELHAAIVERDAALAHIDFLKKTRSWRITRPLRAALQLLRHGSVQAEPGHMSHSVLEFAQRDQSSVMPEGHRRPGMTDRPDARYGYMRRLHAAYQSLPLPPGIRAILRQAMRRTRHAAGAMSRRLHATDAFSPPRSVPALQDAALPDYVIWGVIDWDFRYQRPQQLAKTLSSSGHRVFYIEASLRDDNLAGFAARQLDTDGRLFGITLFVRGAPVIYGGEPAPSIVDQLRRSIGELLLWTASRRIVSLVQHPFWYEAASVLPNFRLVYDCLDNHEGFGNNAATILALEQKLIREADLVTFSSDWLAEYWAGQRTGASTVIRNAADHAFFCAPPAETYRDRSGRRVIGYYGAIAEWFDTDLVAAVARAFPDCIVMLVGSDSAGVGEQLGRYPNIQFVGEIPYRELPRYLYGFDVCLLPFHISPLTLATNPTKVYEYLSAGKPVVSVDLPEMRQFGDRVHIALDQQDFILAVGQALAAPGDGETGRRQFAAQQTWAHRAGELVEAVEDCRGDPQVSIIVVTYNNLALTQACLASIEADRDCFRGEVIVVDNASSDGTAEFLRQWSVCSGRQVILNESNRGFAAANNQGLAVACGEYLVLLNNDTQVTAGWTVGLRRHLQRHPELGLIGPVTNNIGNEARVDVFYRTPAEMPAAARQYTCRHFGKLLRLPTLAFFCIMFSRSTYERIGPLDEEFGLGFFEDDDYCRRVEQAGLDIACAEDVFVHHHLSASFGQMSSSTRQALFDKNKAIYERKWGRWIPHRSRHDPS